MPCRVDPSPEEERRGFERRASAFMAPLLCGACRALARLGYDFDENPELSRWWAAHQAEDKRREDAELAKRLRTEHARHLAKTLTVADMTDDQRALLRAEGYL